tara:strand:+ start:492 stop:839 length:348 start_codon:yes stop_codon:yes gene_type:complete
MTFKNKIKEAQIQKAIMEFLRFQRIQCWRINTVGIPDGRGAFRFNNEMRGMADICLIFRGLSVWMEVKNSTGRQSPNQKEFQRQVEAAGGFYFLVRSVEDAVVAINQLEIQTGKK